MQDQHHPAPKLLEAIARRRSTRQFLSTPLDPEAVRLLLEAGLRAPSSRNRHSTQFVLIDERETLQALSYMRGEGVDFLQDVPLAIIVLGSPMEGEYWLSDASLAAGYIQLQAEELGLGSCWAQICGQHTANGQDADEYVRQLLDIPYQLEVVCAIAVGSKAQALPPRPIEELRWEQIHLGKYSLPEGE